jgi:phage tail tape-measure protein
MKMIVIFSSVMLATVMATAPADAKGCLKGAVAGGAVGHYAGHHGLLGAAAGCLIGRHEATKGERDQERARQQGARDDRNPDPYYR